MVDSSGEVVGTEHLVESVSKSPKNGFEPLIKLSPLLGERLSKLSIKRVILRWRISMRSLS